jgi:hypothetical protein
MFIIKLKNLALSTLKIYVNTVSVKSYDQWDSMLCWSCSCLYMLSSVSTLFRVRSMELTDLWTSAIYETQLSMELSDLWNSVIYWTRWSMEQAQLTIRVQQFFNTLKTYCRSGCKKEICLLTLFANFEAKCENNQIYTCVTKYNLAHLFLISGILIFFKKYQNRPMQLPDNIFFTHFLLLSF